jgi:hypothetical protein
MVIIPNRSWYAEGRLYEVLGNHPKYNKKNPTAIPRYSPDNDLWLFLRRQDGYCRAKISAVSVSKSAYFYGH